MTLGLSWLWTQCDVAGVQELKLHEGHGGLKEAATLFGETFGLRLNYSANFSLAGKGRENARAGGVAAGLRKCLPALITVGQRLGRSFPSKRKARGYQEESVTPQNATGPWERTLSVGNEGTRFLRGTDSRRQPQSPFQHTGNRFDGKKKY